MEVHEFCAWHKEQQVMLALEERGFKWPKEIKKEHLPGRIKALLPALAKLARDPHKSTVFKDAEDLWQAKGRRHCITKHGMWEASRIWGMG